MFQIQVYFKQGTPFCLTYKSQLAADASIAGMLKEKSVMLVDDFGTELRIGGDNFSHLAVVDMDKNDELGIILGRRMQMKQEQANKLSSLRASAN